VWDVSKTEFEKLSPEDKKKNKDLFGFGLQFITEEQRARRIVLMDEYNVYMHEPFELRLHYLNPEDLLKIDIEFDFYQILKNFFFPNSEPIQETKENPKTPPGKSKMKVVK
jgi:hypothetical protein